MKALLLKLILLLFFIIPNSVTEEINTKSTKSRIKPIDKFKVLFLEVNSTFNFKPSKRGFFEKHLNTYCYSGESKTLGRLLESIELQLEIEGDDYTQYEGSTPNEVEEHYSEKRSIFSLNIFSQKHSRLSLSPFMQQCIGIETVQSYNVTLHQEKIDYYRSTQLLVGIVMFLFAGIMSRNSVFYYITGIIFGICSSFLFLIWLSGKLMPKRTMMYGVLIGGWTVGYYLIRMLWDIQLIMMTYRNYVCWYIIITGIISFFFCYRWGPPKNKRSQNIIKWLLQLMSLALIYFSSNFKEASLAIMFMIFTLHYFPRALKQVFNLRTKTSKECLNEKKPKVDSVSRARELRDDCPQWRLNSPQQQLKDSKFKGSTAPTINTGFEQRLISTTEYMNNSGARNYNSEDGCSGSDVSLGEHDLTRRKLYPLPDGSFILSERPPIIITPQSASAIYRSTPIFPNDETNEDDCTPKNHYSHVPLAAHSHRLTAAVSTSHLLVRRHATPSPSHIQRSSSVQRVQSRSFRMITAIKKHHGSKPKIKIEHLTSGDDS